MKKWVLLSLFLLVNENIILAAPIGSQIIGCIRVDQFGYMCEMDKVAVIAKTMTGLDPDNCGSYNPSTSSNQFQIRRWSDDNVMFTGTILQWNGGATHSQSGDRGWWFDFSTFKTPGDYYVWDIGQGKASYKFTIGDDIYDEVLKNSVRMFFYQRQNTNQINSTYGGVWNYSTVAFSQDMNAGPQTGASTVASAPTKDMRGGWSDAGDYNKYINFTITGVIELLEAYRDNPTAFKDSWNIPESGNGVPDLLDEVRYELEWMRKMRNSDGSTHNKIGSLATVNENSPPSNNFGSRYYVYTCPSSAYTIAAVFSLSAIVFEPFDATYATTLTNEASIAYSWAKSQSWNNDCDNTFIQSGDGDGNMGEGDPNKNRDNYRTTAALYMFERTGNAAYRTDFDSWYSGTSSYTNNFWDPYRSPVSTALLRYGSISGASSIVANNIRNSFINFVSNTSYAQAGQYYLRYSAYASNVSDRLDLYRSYLPNSDYVWGSNMIKATCGLRNLDIDRYSLGLASNRPVHVKVASDYLHYLHGVNPMGYCYLTNMYDYGAEKCPDRMYHMWFGYNTIYDGRTGYDGMVTSSRIGPPPAYLVGGPNIYYSGAIAVVNNEKTNNRVQKVFQSVNYKGPSFDYKPWELTECGIYYQACYVRLLAGLMAKGTACGIALPFSSLDFTLQKEINGIKLNWYIDDHKNISHFEIYKSYDGIEFNLVTIISPGFINSYSYIDSELMKSDIVYYRIEQTDKDSYKTISVIKSTSTKSNQILIFPNPSSKDFYIKSSDKLNLEHLALYKSDGTLINQDYIEFDSSTDTYIVRTFNLNPGLYLLTINSNGISENRRVILIK